MAEAIPKIDLVCSATDLGIVSDNSASIEPGYVCDVPVAPHGIIAVSETKAESEWSALINENSHLLPDNSHESEIGCAIIGSDAEGDLVLSGTVVDVDPDSVITDHGIRHYLVEPDSDGGRLAEKIDQRKHETVDPFGVTIYESPERRQEY